MKTQRIREGAFKVRIEKTFPIPPKKGLSSRIHPRYPFHRMEVGDSIFIPATENSATVLSAMSHTFGKKFTPIRSFRARQSVNSKGVVGTRIWRTK